MLIQVNLEGFCEGLETYYLAFGAFCTLKSNEISS